MNVGYAIFQENVLKAIKTSKSSFKYIVISKS